MVEYRVIRPDGVLLRQFLVGPPYDEMWNEWKPRTAVFDMCDSPDEWIDPPWVFEKHVNGSWEKLGDSEKGAAAEALGKAFPLEEHRTYTIPGEEGIWRILERHEHNDARQAIYLERVVE